MKNRRQVFETLLDVATPLLEVTVLRSDKSTAGKFWIQNGETITGACSSSNAETGYLAFLELMSVKNARFEVSESSESGQQDGISIEVRDLIANEQSVIEHVKSVLWPESDKETSPPEATAENKDIPSDTVQEPSPRETLRNLRKVSSRADTPAIPPSPAKPPSSFARYKVGALVAAGVGILSLCATILFHRDNLQDRVHQDEQVANEIADRLLEKDRGTNYAVRTILTPAGKPAQGARTSAGRSAGNTIANRPMPTEIYTSPPWEVYRTTWGGKAPPPSAPTASAAAANPPVFIPSFHSPFRPPELSNTSAPGVGDNWTPPEHPAAPLTADQQEKARTAAREARRLMALGQLQQAASVIRPAMTAFPQDVDVRRTAIEIYVRLKRLDEARSACHTGMKLAGNHKDYQTFLNLANSFPAE